MKRGQISLQMYTVRELAGRDMPDTLRRLSEMGYRAVEFAGYGGLTAPELRAVLDEYGLRAASAHVPFEEWMEPGQILDDMHTLGCSHAVVPMMAPEHRRDESAVARFAGDLNRLGEASERDGVGFSYHNHDFEFAPLGETTAWDVLVRETDPRLVGLELDVYWARYAGVDPEALIGALADRISLLHLKDMVMDDARSDAPVGEGAMPWDELLAAGEAAGVEWYIVEQDHPRDALEDVRRSLMNLERMVEGQETSHRGGEEEWE